MDGFTLNTELPVRDLTSSYVRVNHDTECPPTSASTVQGYTNFMNNFVLDENST